MKIHTSIHTSFSENIIDEILGLAELCHSESDIKKILDLLAEKVARIMRADVCSIYLINQHSRELVLKATKGLNPDAIDRVRMKVGEGLVGKTIEWLKPVSMAVGKRSKKFKFFPETGEDKFSSFLSVPLIYNRHPIGVLVIQNAKPLRYSERSVHLLMTLAIPAVSVIEKARLLGSFGQVSSKAESVESDKKESGQHRDGIFHQGIGASPGIGIGILKILNKHSARPMVVHAPGPIHAEVEKMRVLEAFRWAEEEILEVQKKARKKFGMEELSIFDAYRMVLESEPFKEQITREIDSGASALQSVMSVINRYTEELALSDDEYIRERIYDIEDLGRKITDRILYGSEVPKSPYVLDSPAILLSEFWSISDFVELDPEKTRGILSQSGGASSHVAILATSLGIPAVLGLSSVAELFRENDTVVMDGSSGVVIANPQQHVKQIYEKEIRADEKAQRAYRRFAKKPAVSTDGRRITVGANMGMIGHIRQAMENGAEEIGLYRTEIPFLIRRSLPTEEEQYQLYRKVLASMEKKAVKIRTLDIGGDKYLPYLNLPKEANPFLGWRSIRISLEREDLFRIQLRALLRASTAGTLHFLFPMISSIEEVRKIKEIVGDVKKELDSKKTPYAANIPMGIMIEVPSAVELADFFIKEVDFFSIGTNDLIQYTLAVDRNNAKVAKLFNPFHPAVLRAIKRTVKAAHRAKKPVSVCGEMAANPMAVVLLIGMGIDNLSMSAPVISRIKNFICRLNYAEAQEMAASVLKMESAEHISLELEKYLRKKGLSEFLPHPTPAL